MRWSNPYLRYSTESWYGASLTVFRAMQIQLKKVIRAIFHLHYNHPTHAYFRGHSIMKIEEIYKLNLSTILFDYNKRQKNNCIAPKLGRNIKSHNHNTRHGTNWQVTRFSGSKSINSNVYQSVKFWNSLPPTIKSASTSLQFKQKI